MKNTACITMSLSLPAWISVIHDMQAFCALAFPLGICNFCKTPALECWLEPRLHYSHHSYAKQTSRASFSMESILLMFSTTGMSRKLLPKPGAVSAVKVHISLIPSWSWQVTATNNTYVHLSCPVKKKLDIVEIIQTLRRTDSAPSSSTIASF